MADATAFSPDYATARARFRAAAHAAGWSLSSHGIGQPDGDGGELTVDVARTGAARPERVAIVSSGLRGVEGFLGSAVQAALLEEELTGWSPPPGLAVVAIHALNPWGFAHLRRANEANVDPCFNFLLDGEQFAGSPGRYAALDALANPRAVGPGPDAFAARAGWAAARYGPSALDDAFDAAQYDFPLGVCWGGDRPQATRVILRDHLPSWLGPAVHRVVHLDVHTGAGSPGARDRLFADAELDPAAAARLGKQLGRAVESRAAGRRAARGALGPWCTARFPRVEYELVTARFATARRLAMAAALRAENRAHHHLSPADARHDAAKRALRDALAPPDAAWRTTAAEACVRLVHAMLVALGA